MILVAEMVWMCGLKIYRKIKYPHQFYFNNIDNQHKDMIEWTSENIKNEWKHWWEYSDPLSTHAHGYSFGFKNKKDAMAFKLRWS